MKVLGSHAWTKSTLQLVKRNEGKKECKQICLLNGVAPDLLSHRYLLTGRGYHQGNVHERVTISDGNCSALFYFRILRLIYAQACAVYYR